MPRKNASAKKNSKPDAGGVKKPKKRSAKNTELALVNATNTNTSDTTPANVLVTDALSRRERRVEMRRKLKKRAREIAKRHAEETEKYYQMMDESAADINDATSTRKGVVLPVNMVIIGGSELTDGKQNMIYAMLGQLEDEDGGHSFERRTRKAAQVWRCRRGTGGSQCGRCRGL